MAYDENLALRPAHGEKNVVRKMKKALITLLQLTPVVLSILLTAAHFSRSGNGLLVVLSLSFLLLLPFRHPLAARLLQGALLLSGLEWIRTLLALASLRQQLGLPWVRLAVILGVVSLFTIASAFIFQSRTLGGRYRLSPEEDPPCHDPQ